MEVQMNKKELEELFHIHKEIQNLEKRITRTKKLSVMVGDVVQNGYKGHAHIYGEDVYRKYKIHKLEDKYQEFQKKIIKKKEEIENYIETIPFSEIRQIFRYRYLDNKNWVQIAHLMNETYTSKEYTESSVRLKHERYLNKKQKIQK